jgi:twitching motility protein PilT
MDLKEFLTRSSERKASDIFIVPNHRPMLYVHDHLLEDDACEIVTAEESERLLREMVGDERFKMFERRKDLDFSYRVSGLGRFRVNAHYQRDTVAMTLRIITPNIPPIESLNLPPIIQEFANLPRGLVLLTGPTGSGKSTTLAAMIDKINTTSRRHIITIEDPIEYEMTSQQCLIEQREVGGDVPNFASGLRHVLRQAPDVILVGEMRDLETTSAAITAAETGHLVFSTLHTQSCAQTIERIVDIFPSDQQRYIQSMLANTLQAVVTQTLLPRCDRPGMIPAPEIMICNAAVRNCIRENRLHEIPNIIETSRGQGMCLLDDTLRILYLNGRISREVALERATNPKAMECNLVE